MPRFVPATRFERKPDLEIRFPPLPRTLAEVSRLLAQRTEVPDTQRLGEIVNDDPLIAVSVLRRINSAYYGVHRRICDIQKAVFLLGFADVCNLVQAAGMMKLRDVIHSPEQAAVFQHILRMSIGSACYTHQMAFFLNLPLKGIAFTVGMLHIAGRLVLLYNKPHDYEALWWTSEHGGAPTVAEERLIFGTDHAELGALAADYWQLPEELVSVIRHYLAPDQLDEYHLRTLAQALAVSVSATEQLYLHKAQAPTFTPPPALYELAAAQQVQPSDLIEVIETLQVKHYAFFDDIAFS